MKRNIWILFVVFGFALGAAACTDPAQGVGTSQQALSDLTPLQVAYCSWFPCERSAPEFDPEVDRGFATDLEKNGGNLPEPVQIEYGSDDTVNRVKICFPETEWRSVHYDCHQIGCSCRVCNQQRCYTIKYGHAIYGLEPTGYCLRGVKALWTNGSYYCKT